MLFPHIALLICSQPTDSGTLQIPAQPGLEDSVLKEFQQSIDFDNETCSYVVRLPWKLDPVIPATHFDLCKQRLHRLLRKLKLNDSLFREYDAIIREQHSNGIIERVPDTNKLDCHYLSHHAVLRPDKMTTKIRIVFDASAKASRESPSLNDCLHAGPQLLPDLFSVLVRFRSYKVGVIADVEKAFLTITVNEIDRDYLRFLWIENDSRSGDHNIVAYRFCRVLFGLKSSPFLLNATVRHHLKQFRDERAICRQLEGDLYVDDLVSGALNDQKAFKLFETARKVLSQSGMNLRKFCTNSATLQSRFSVWGSEDADSVKVLGICWNRREDFFHFDLARLDRQARILQATKRSVLKVSASLYDPLGLLSPYTVIAKMLFQRLCVEKVEWDVPLPKSHADQWKSWISELSALNSLRIPRCYLGCLPSYPVDARFELHGFSDGSSKAYAATVYIRVHWQDQISTALVASKTRLNPMQKQTIPRTELLGALILARLMATVADSLERLSPSLNYWTDSTVVLGWIRRTNADHMPAYVASRIAEIKSLTQPDSWRYVRSADNPADLPTRGIDACTLVRSTLWWQGPQWLRLQQWPVEAEDEVESEIEQPALALATLCERPIVRVDKVVDISRFSSLSKLLRVTARCLQFVYRLRDKHRISEHVELELLQKAERLWIRSIQNECYSDLKQELNSGRPVQQKFRDLRPFLDRYNVIRCCTRIRGSEFQSSFKDPVLLPPNDRFTELVILSDHLKVLHSGVRDTLLQLREKYWIPRGRQAVKKVLRRCVICRRIEGLPYACPPVPPLPSYRVSMEPAFTYTGVDFAGPLYAHSGRKVSKCYICLFTCGVVRAVHLELVNDLTTQTFVRALRRFSSRRGIPRIIVSDNAKTFKAADNEMEELVHILETVASSADSDIKGYLSSQRIKWTFIVERAPWWGGFYERLVRTVKSSLRKVIGKTRLCFDELRTVVSEVEAVVNSRPLIYIPSEPEFILTPAHFLTGKRLTSLPDSNDMEKLSSDPETLTKLLDSSRYQYRSNFLNQATRRYWKMWRNEYLDALRLSDRRATTERIKSVSVGDVVLVKDDLPRLLWRAARVQRVLHGRDGHIRAAVLKTISKTGVIELKRPVQLLYPLETAQESSSENH